MASLAESLPPAPAQTGPLGRLLRSPGLCFWVAGLVIYGLAAWNFCAGHFLNQTSRDLWQHLASLRTLIENPFDPANPFVATAEGSRHFNPYWVSVALLAKAVGWNEWQAIAFAGFVSAGTLLAGIHAFGRAFYRSPWGPFALLLAMAFGWWLPVSHTGYHSLGTLIEGIAYPAALLVGLSLLLMAFVIRALRRPILAWLIVPLTAFMFATHQLGAGIGFLAASCFILCWPQGSLKARAGAAAAIGAGLLVSAAWPYHGPFEAIARTGNATWTGGIDYYRPFSLASAFVPSLIGLAGLRHRRFARDSVAVLAAFALFAALFWLGAFGMPIATRFIMPAVLMLHIGLGALILALARDWPRLKHGAQLGWFTLAAASLAIFAFFSIGSLSAERALADKLGSAHEAALALTRDIPDSEPIAAFDVSAWPVVATGQRVVSVPWPEPMIEGLADRQAATERLFDPALSRDERLRLAARWGAKSLLLNRSGPLRRPMPEGLIERLDAQSVRRSEAGPFIRFDLR